MNIEVILVDENDKQIGTAEKLAAHQSSQLHRAFSIFVFNSAGQALIQKRAEGKYHSAGLWSNTCCSHPRPSEDLKEAVHRRLQEEMGFNCPLEQVDHLIYEVKFDNGLIEHEYNHVFLGRADVEPTVDPTEASAWQWVEADVVSEDLKSHPEKYTYWFRRLFDKVVKHAAIA